jgi:hypothetical protein
MKPNPAPTMKLAIAQMMAMIEGMLKAGAGAVLNAGRLPYSMGWVAMSVAPWFRCQNEIVR